MARIDSHPLSPRAIQIWRILQVVVWCVGLGIFLLLLFAPSIGLHAFWDVLIPVAPALVVFVPGLWRNICPLASTALAARHMNLSARKIPSSEWRDWLNLAGVILLLAMVPLRHVIMDTSGLATAIALAVLALLSIGMGLVFEWKSGWCSGLCPIHPVEKFYGSQPLLSMPNAHCVQCENCVSLCPDSTPAMHPLLGAKSGAQKVAATMMIGGFAGFIWGWFHVPDYMPGEGWRHLPQIYGTPLLGGLVTLVPMLILLRVFPERNQRILVRGFAATAVACYYWYRIPALFGFGLYPGDGMLVDLQGILPEWFPLASRVVTTTLLFAWLGLGPLVLGRVRCWVVRPPIAGDCSGKLDGQGNTPRCNLASATRPMPSIRAAVRMSIFSR